MSSQTNMKCFNCKKERPTTEFMKEQICQECQDTIGEGADRFELQLILNRRGEKWVLNEIGNYDAFNQIIHT